MVTQSVLDDRYHAERGNEYRIITSARPGRSDGDDAYKAVTQSLHSKKQLGILLHKVRVYV